MDHQEPDSPPPFPQSRPSTNPGLFRAAATISIVSAAVSFGLVTTFERAMNFLRESMGPEVVAQFAAGLMIVAVLLLALGLVSGVIALSGIPKHGREGLLIKGLSGLVLSLLFGAIMVPNFIKGRNRAKEADSFTKALTNLTHSSSEEFTDPVESDKRVVATREALEKVAASSGGLDGAMAQAMSGYMRQLQTVLTPYTEAYEEMQRAEVLDFTQLEDIEDIQRKKEIVRKFMAANQNLKERVKNGAAVFEEELAGVKMSDTDRREVLFGFKNGYERTVPANMKIRDTDNQLGEKLIELLGIAETQWGRWKFDETQDAILFESDSAADQYSAAMTQISKIADEQAEAQETLFRIQAELTGN